MIKYDKIEVTFGDHKAIPELSLHVAEGEFFTLLGPSGCGKTTALRTLAGFIEPTGGEIYIDGTASTRVPSEKRRIGMVFQNYALFPSMTVGQNIAFGLTVQKMSKADTKRLVTEIAGQVQLSTDQLDKNVSELSGGQQQRVAIARALVLKPRILLLDEPLSNLDAKLRVQLREQLKDLQRDLGITTVYVTHDQEEALTMSDRIAVFNRGVIEQIGTPADIYDRSRTEFVCTFIGAINRLAAHTVRELVGGGATDLDPNKTSYVRLEKVSLRPSSNSASLRGSVQERAYHGAYSTYTLRSGESTIRAMVIEDGAAPLPEGSSVTVHIDPSSILQY
ncbi:MAG: ABC transporter ATP-binding protein [Cryobacterium sp.]|uniref:ABC transporter ATP-binding protein n=1 Tax=unclassified Cryobacterium TaxID=2649013 RepID=UPI0018C92E4A|nr:MULTISPECIES: ABC transporter ATP-binding protein [unclassified Cryobacterium]MCY7403659.1 ABC transporter ATP-binding protein [Cryobacterium sp.]MEC5155649.1 iron(III) transport system ATP-binding protein [Cryobacterium sp. CAN_C3]